MKDLKIKLSDNALEDLKKKQKELDLPSLAEVIRNSISMTKFLEQEQREGNEIALRNKKSRRERGTQRRQNLLGGGNPCTCLYDYRPIYRDDHGDRIIQA